MRVLKCGHGCGGLVVPDIVACYGPYSYIIGFKRMLRCENCGWVLFEPDEKNKGEDEK